MAKSNSTQTIRRTPQVVPGRQVDPTMANHSADRYVRIMRELQEEKASSAITLEDLTDTNVSSLADGDVLTWVAAENEWENKPASLGGNVTTAAAFASRPAGNPGDLFFATDGYYLERKGASVWAPFSLLVPCTRPDDTAFSWVNQGSSTVETSRGGIYLEHPAAGSATDASLRVKTAPATPYTITAHLKLNVMFVTQFLQAGLLFRESSTGRFVTMHLQTNAIFVSKWTSGTVENADYYNSDALVGTPEWFQISDDGTNLKYRVSRDGYHWITIFTKSRTDWMAGGPDSVGIFVNAENIPALQQPCGLLLLSWKET